MARIVARLALWLRYRKAEKRLVVTQFEIVSRQINSVVIPVQAGIWFYCSTHFDIKSQLDFRLRGNDKASN